MHALLSERELHVLRVVRARRRDIQHNARSAARPLSAAKRRRTKPAKNRDFRDFWPKKFFEKIEKSPTQSRCRARAKPGPRARRARFDTRSRISKKSGKSGRTPVTPRNPGQIRPRRGPRSEPDQPHVRVFGAFARSAKVRKLGREADLAKDRRSRAVKTRESRPSGDGAKRQKPASPGLKAPKNATPGPPRHFGPLKNPRDASNLPQNRTIFEPKIVKKNSKKVRRLYNHRDVGPF